MTPLLFEYKYENIYREFMEQLDKEKLLEAANNITNPLKQKEEIYMLMDALGITYKRTNCGRCLRDYLNIVREELGAIENAAENSEFNENEWEYVYIHPRTVLWHGHKINQRTPRKIIDEFVKEHPIGYYLKQALLFNKTQNDNTMNIPVPYILEGNAVHNIVEGQTGVPFPAGLQSVATEENNEENNENNNQEQ